MNLFASKKRNCRISILLVGLVLAAAGTIAGSRLSAQPASPSSPVPSLDSKASRAAAFLTRIRLADPEYQLILMAGLKETELNLLLSRHAKAKEMPILLKGLLGQLSKTLPNTDLSVVAFWPVVPLREAGTARLNAASGEVTYTPGWTPPAGKAAP